MPADGFSRAAKHEVKGSVSTPLRNLWATRTPKASRRTWQLSSVEPTRTLRLDPRACTRSISSSPYWKTRTCAD
jgi:hypothetical protein